MPPSEAIDNSIQIDPWLSSILGYDAYRVTTLPETGLPATAQGLFYGKLSTTQVSTVSQWTTAGFRVIDVNTTFERRPAKRGYTPHPTIHIARAAPEDHLEILNIAETAFQWSRFHLDPQIPRAAANSIKREWVANALAGKRGDGVYSARLQGSVAGFLIVLGKPSQAQSVGLIDLIAVAKPHQQKGVGEALVEHFVNQSGCDFDVLRVGTQIANVASCRLYEKMGFRFADSSYVLHAHTRGGKGLA